jgi:dTDP-L-rhamnose 4-epimerase
MNSDTGILLLTGGAGFIGSHIVDALVGAGHHVRAIDSLLPNAHGERPDYLNDSAEYVFGDINDTDLVERALDHVNVVSHQASMVGLGTDLGDVTSYVHHNDAGTASLLLAMHRRSFSGRIVLGSSMVVYGEGAFRCDMHGIVRPEPRDEGRLERGEWEPPCPDCGRDLVPGSVSEDAPTDPRNVYAATKLHQEHLCSAYARETGASLAVLRYHNVYGPRMPQRTPYAGVASIFRSALEAGEAPRVFEDGGQLRDFVHVHDVAHANVLAATRDASTGTFNVASGQAHTVGEMAVALAAAYPNGAAPVITGNYRLGDVRHVFASVDRARRELGYAAQVTFARGMRDFSRAPLRSPTLLG